MKSLILSLKPNELSLILDRDVISFNNLNDVFKNYKGWVYLCDSDYKIKREIVAKCKVKHLKSGNYYKRLYYISTIRVFKKPINLNEFPELDLISKNWDYIDIQESKSYYIPKNERGDLDG